MYFYLLVSCKLEWSKGQRFCVNEYNNVSNFPRLLSFLENSFHHDKQKIMLIYTK